MYHRDLCRFALELDDVALHRRAEGCICLACHGRATSTARCMPQARRRNLVTTLA
jgi:hypothetical protein